MTGIVFHNIFFKLKWTRKYLNVLIYFVWDVKIIIVLKLISQVTIGIMH